MTKTVEHVHWPDAPDMWMPYAPAIKVRGGTTVYLAGVTAAPVYHHHPHRPEEFDNMPKTMEGQARAALENLKRGLEAVGASFADVVEADRFVTDLTDQDSLNRVWAEYFSDAKPATTTVQVVRLATDSLPRRDQRDRGDRLNGGAWGRTSRAGDPTALLRASSTTLICPRSPRPSNRSNPAATGSGPMATAA